MIASSVDNRYKRYRLEIITTTFLGYVVFYISRKNFTYAAPALMDELGMTTTQFGAMSSAFYILYGVAKFSSGIMADKVSPRLMLGPALIVIGLLNFVMGASDSITALMVVYALTAIMQGSGFPPIAKALSYWFSRKERGMWYSFWNTSHNVGGAIAPIIASTVIAYSGNWRMAFYVPAVIAIVMGLIAIVFMRDKPQKYGLPSVGAWKNDPLEKAHEADSPPQKIGKEVFVKYILKNPVIWVAIIGDLCIYIVRTVITDWPAIYYTQVAGWKLVTASSLSAWFEVGGIVGGLTAGFISDLLFGASRWKTCLLFSVILFISVMLLPLFQHSAYLISASLFALIGAGLYGPQLLFSLGIIESAHKDAAGSATGLKGLVTYLGAASAGLPVALIQQHFSWGGVFQMMVITNIVLLFSIVWLTRQGESVRR